MYLTKEEENILNGNEGEMLSKLMKFIVEIGDSFGAEKLIEIISAHTVLNISLNICSAAAEVLHRIAEAGNKDHRKKPWCKNRRNREGCS